MLLDVLKLSKSESIPLGDNSRPRNDKKKWFNHNELSFMKLFGYVKTRNKSNIHFMTIRPSTSYIIARYFNNIIPSKVDYNLFLTNKIKKICSSYSYAGSIELNEKHRMGIHYHIMFFELTKKKYNRLRIEIRDALTIDHKVLGSQSAIHTSEKDYSNFEKGINYFLGKIRTQTNIVFKSSYIEHIYNINESIYRRLINNGKLAKMMESYHDFLYEVKSK